jgi:hypothetical protein
MPVMAVTHFEKRFYELMAIRADVDVCPCKPVDLNLLSAYVRRKLNLGCLVRFHPEPVAHGNTVGWDGWSILVA